MTNPAHYIRIIEEAIASLGLDPATLRRQQPGQWTLQQGSAQVYIDIFQLQEKGPIYIGILSPIMDLPKSNTEGFLKELLQLNNGILGAAFSLHGQTVTIRTARVIDGLDNQEALQLISLIANAADFYDDQLQSKYPHQEPIGFKTSYSAPPPPEVPQEPQE